MPGSIPNTPESSQVIPPEGVSGKSYTGKVSYMSREDDFAIIDVNGVDLQNVLPICYSNYPKAG